MYITDIDKAADTFSHVCPGCGEEQVIAMSDLLLGYRTSEDQIVLPQCPGTIGKTEEPCGGWTVLLRNQRTKKPESYAVQTVHMIAEELRVRGQIRGKVRTDTPENRRADKLAGLLEDHITHDFSKPATVAPSWRDDAVVAKLKGRVRSTSEKTRSRAKASAKNRGEPGIVR
jgi:hypothetical protein